MKIAIATKDKWTQVSGHAGQTHQWLLFDCQPGQDLPGPQRIELTKDQFGCSSDFQERRMNPSHDCRAILMAELLARPAAAQAAADPLRPLLASLLAGCSLQQGVLTATLGLNAQAFQVLWHDYFPGEHLNLQNGPGEDIAELEDLLNLLLEYRAGRHESEVWLAHSVAYSCCGRNHLWQDLGLADRNELSLLMTTAFPALAALNVNDMKWKKFIYHFYCKREGIYVCPAPSCGECADHAKCYSPET